MLCLCCIFREVNAEFVLTLVSDHRDQLHKLLEPVRQYCLCQGIKLSSLLKNLCKNLKGTEENNI